MTGAFAADPRRIALLLEYDGTAYRGSQYQEDGRTIQSELEAAIENLTGETVRAAFAGRTDAGVHALGQVAAFDTRARLGAAQFVGGLNHFLPRDIAVRAAAEADARFDPRRDARSRLYRYCIDARPVRSPLLRDRTWHVPRPLDVEAMRRAAKRLEGTHDVAAFAGPYDGTTVRTLRRCEVTADRRCVRVEMEAEAFLPHQVRRTVGPLVEVGSGRMSGDTLAALLEEAKPSSAGPAAPACGLYLVSIAYDRLDLEAGEGNGRDG
ncbi:MAG: tRNA pseudouridine(38-40) synthase TruA [Dehalococcoidia bacterium]